MTRGRAGGKKPTTKVAVLGGGLGAMAAAFELTAPELEGQYEVTVYQPGWRLGGKCASGRNALHNDRIEEHGLHVWFGFYDNAFHMIQRCYEEWNRPTGTPLRTWDAAFKKCNDIVLFEQWRGQWTPWPLHMPPDELEPGSAHVVGPWDFLHRLLAWLLDEWGTVRKHSADAIPPEAALAGSRLHHEWIPPLAAETGVVLERLEHEGAAHVLELAFKVAEAHLLHPDRHGGAEHHLPRIGELLRSFKHWLFEHVLGPAIDDEHVRRYAIMLDFWTTVVSGLIADRVFEYGFGELNKDDLRTWLHRHGAEQLTLDHAAFLNALYDLVFAYQDGDKSRPDLAAGKALQAMIRIVACYKGAVLWKMQAGMGDTVFSPLYDVLRSRGVRFRFFHRVTKLGLSPDRQSVATIEVQPQVELKRGWYNPIVQVKRRRCWPSQPKWHLIERGDEWRERGLNFEHEHNPLGLAPITLHAGEDFDQIVLGISVGALPSICEALADANTHFREMLENSHTVMTEGIQLWLGGTATELGWPHEPAITTSYVKRADTFSNMAQLLPCETWKGPDQPADVVYLCGVVEHTGIGTQADADARVRANALNFLREDAGRLWPRAVDPGSGEFDFSTLVCGSGAAGEQRLDEQFLGANFQPTERYVMTRAGTVSYRLRADQSGFENLKLAGDWTRNGIDGGSVEAAVTSGMQAARAITKRETHIQGEHGWLVDD
jgi:uncharacterized protein with NAD-binding domain and iron-sulfur cluster